VRLIVLLEQNKLSPYAKTSSVPDFMLWNKLWDAGRIPSACAKESCRKCVNMPF